MTGLSHRSISALSDISSPSCSQERSPATSSCCVVVIFPSNWQDLLGGPWSLAASRYPLSEVRQLLFLSLESQNPVCKVVGNARGDTWRANARRAIQMLPGRARKYIRSTSERAPSTRRRILQTAPEELFKCVRRNPGVLPEHTDLSCDENYWTSTSRASK